MDKVYLNNHIKSEILNICGQPASKPYMLEGETSLYSLGYKVNIHGQELEKRLQEIAIDYNTGKQIPSGIISKDFTVGQCIRLIMA